MRKQNTTVAQSPQATPHHKSTPYLTREQILAHTHDPTGAAKFDSFVQPNPAFARLMQSSLAFARLVQTLEASVARFASFVQPNPAFKWVTQMRVHEESVGRFLKGVALDDQIRAELALRDALKEGPPIEGRFPPDLLQARLRRGVWLFGKDRAALAEEGAPLDEFLLLARWQARQELYRRGGRQMAVGAFWRFEDQLTGRYLRQILESDRCERDARRFVPLSEPLLEFLSSTQNVEPTEPDPRHLAAVRAQWQALLATAGPAQRRLLERWLESPDSSLAEIGRELHMLPNAAYQAMYRLRRRPA